MIKKKLISALFILFSVAFAQEEGVNSGSVSAYLVDFDKNGEENNNWKVRLNTSADFLLSRMLSYTKNVRVENTGETRLFKAGNSGNVLGVRVNYPNMPVNAFAEVKPPLSVKFYEPSKYNEKGLLTNVGVIKSIQAFVKGKNYPHSMFVNLRSEKGEQNSYFLGYLNFSGWEVKSYENPNYLSDLKFIDFDKIPDSPGYPNADPYIALESISFFKHGGNVSGDFITYIGWIEVDYDRGNVKEEDDIDDESVWQIQTDEYNKRSALEKKRLDKSRKKIEKEMRKKNLSVDTEDSNNAESN